MKQALITGFMGILLFSANQAFGWGALGHRATGFVAESKLSPATKKAVQQILKTQTMADAATWADQIRSDPNWGHQAYYHFDKVPDKGNLLKSLSDLSPADRAKGGLMEAVLFSQRMLQDPRSNALQREVALKFLIHFVGDLHQPLHTGRPEDKGGNTIMLNWFGQPQQVTLHSVWDTAMILTGHADIFNQLPQGADGSLAYAKWLIGRFRNADSPKETRSSPEIWLNESMAYRDLAYDPRYKSDQKAYQGRNMTVLDMRVYAAGVRIAETLNRIFANQAEPSAQTVLWNRIEQIVGKLANIIAFYPKAPTGPQEPDQHSWPPVNLGRR